MSVPLLPSPVTQWNEITVPGIEGPVRALKMPVPANREFLRWALLKGPPHVVFRYCGTPSKVREATCCSPVLFNSRVAVGAISSAVTEGSASAVVISKIPALRVVAPR